MYKRKTSCFDFQLPGVTTSLKCFGRLLGTDIAKLLVIGSDGCHRVVLLRKNTS